MKIPKDIQELFDKTPPIKKEDMAQLIKAGKELENDKKFQMSILKSIQKENDNRNY